MRATTDELNNAIGFQATAMAAMFTQAGAWTTRLTAILIAVTNTIDAMIRPRVDPTTVATDPILKRLCLSIAVYDAWMSFARNQLPEAVRLDKEQAMKMLEKIQRGELEIIPATGTVNIVTGEFTSSSQVLSINL